MTPNKLRVGVEIHARILSKTKLFSSANSLLNLQHEVPRPNSQLDWFDLGLPGTMPRLNEECVRRAVKAGLALKCEINRYSTFERKHYFYPDQPLGYQITQQNNPIALRGEVALPKAGRAIRIERIQLEQDTGKTIVEGYGPTSRVLVDYNRAGTGLMEIVSAPDATTPQETVEYVSTVQSLLKHIGVCDGKMEDGSLRADVNVSWGMGGRRVEVKNLNSLRSIREAVEYEEKRLSMEMMEGTTTMTATTATTMAAETRGFNPKTGETFLLRKKETWNDYRYMPEPDLPPLMLSEAFIEEVRREMGETPQETRERLARQYGLGGSRGDVLEHLARDAAARGFFERACTADPTLDPSLVYRWYCILKGEMRGSEVADGVDVVLFARLVKAATERGTGLLPNEAKAAMSEGNEGMRRLLDLRSPASEARGGGKSRDEGGGENQDLRRRIVEALKGQYAKDLADYAKAVEAKDEKRIGGLMNFFTGKAAKALKGADPRDVRKVLGEALRELCEGG